MAWESLLYPFQPLSLHPLVPLPSLVENYVDHLVVFADISCRDRHQRVNDVTE